MDYSCEVIPTSMLKNNIRNIGNIKLNEEDDFIGDDEVRKINKQPSTSRNSKTVGLGEHTFHPNKGSHFKFSANSLNMNESIAMDIQSESDVSCQIVRLNAQDQSVINMFQSEYDKKTQVIYLDDSQQSEFTRMERGSQYTKMERCNDDNRSDTYSMKTSFRIKGIQSSPNPKPVKGPSPTR